MAFALEALGDGHHARALHCRVKLPKHSRDAGTHRHVFHFAPLRCSRYHLWDALCRLSAGETLLRSSVKILISRTGRDCPLLGLSAGVFWSAHHLREPCCSILSRVHRRGRRAQELVSRVDYDGAVTSGVVIAASFAVLAFNGWREQRQAVKAAEKQGTLEAP